MLLLTLAYFSASSLISFGTISCLPFVTIKSNHILKMRTVICNAIHSPYVHVGRIHALLFPPPIFNVPKLSWLENNSNSAISTADVSARTISLNCLKVQMNCRTHKCPNVTYIHQPSWVPVQKLCPSPHHVLYKFYERKEGINTTRSSMSSEY